MDAARAAMGQGRPFAACPWNGDGANGPGAKRRAGWNGKRFWLLLAGPAIRATDKRNPPSGAEQMPEATRKRSEQVEVTRGKGFAIFHPTLRRTSPSAHTTHPAPSSPTPSPPEPSGHPFGSLDIRDETACPPSPARTAAPAVLPSVHPRSTADSSGPRPAHRWRRRWRGSRRRRPARHSHPAPTRWRASATTPNESERTRQLAHGSGSTGVWAIRQYPASRGVGCRPGRRCCRTASPPPARASGRRRSEWRYPP